jgi:glycosyltransferase involved in cell wall biosynthesis
MSNQKFPLTPLVSVIIPAYNSEAFIERTLHSVLQQTYQNIEVLVVNDGSSDRTVEIVERLAQTEPRLRLLHQPNSGVAAARNLGIQHARGEFIAPIDADDLWHQDNLAKQVKCFLDSDESVGLTYAWSYDIDEYDQPLKGFSAATMEGSVYKTLLCHNFIGNASATLIRRKCLEIVGGYDGSFAAQNAQGCEDLDLYLRIAEHFQFKVVPHFLIGYRKPLNSMSCDYRKMAKSHAMVINRFRGKHPEVPDIVYNFSRSSLYIYFAKQNQRVQNSGGTLFWLKQACSIDWLTPLVRPDFYQLALLAILRLCIHDLNGNQQDQVQQRQFHRGSLPFPNEHKTPSIPNEQDVAVLLKVLAGWGVYHLVNYMPGLKLWNPIMPLWQTSNCRYKS